MSNTKRLLVSVAAIVLMSATFADAAMTVMVSVKGKKQGSFAGESPRDAHKDKLEAVAYTFTVKSPRDAATGQASGKRQYGQLQITKKMGASTPQFFQALAGNEPLTTVTLDFYKTNANGEEFNFFTIKLSDATVAAIRQQTGSDAAPSAAAGGKHTQPGVPPQMEDISFTFKKIEMENKEAKTMATDDVSLGGAK